jgi:hypothetical protein
VQPLHAAMPYRLQANAGILKVMVPALPPRAAAAGDSVTAVAGLRYVMLYVDDMDGVVSRLGTSEDASNSSRRTCAPVSASQR